MTTRPTALPSPPDGGWSLDAFISSVADTMADLGIDAPAPDRRTVRYYSTFGVLDRPTMAGRQARYHQRQLRQVLAVKRLQAQGVRLAAIAQRLAGLDPDQLHALAVGDTASIGSCPEPAAQPPVEFWMRRQPVNVSPPAARSPAPASAEPASPQPPAFQQTVVELAPGVRLVLDGTEINPTELTALRQSAAGLVDTITAFGLDRNRP